MFVGVAGVSSLVREDQVRELLAKCGKVEELRVYRDNTDPRQRTVCVNFEKEEDGMVALHLTDKFLIDRLIKVERLDNWPRGIQEITFQGEPVRRAPPPSAPVPAPKPAAAAAAAAAGRAPQQQQQQQGQQQQQPAPAASKPDAPAATSTATSAAATGASAHTPAASKETPEPSPEVYVADVPTTVAKPDLILFFTRACGPVRTIDVRGDAVHTPSIDPPKKQKYSIIIKPSSGWSRIKLAIDTNSDRQ
ncbi:hypothetical protein PTSG_03191 [Salpingoeca rosetta]|uniref:RRM domain-containing protein n=1 Tax=Salpingoeca rosetta (strain ATCC 50818 / BSB-021) TaxID=946362 RepID=F2U4H3_SALR5|nr:uncharacterized protein PTSG_03191 [Salpingoeca rosetta]EGD82539.1 hypothetical protein PTSG_03191 [Salpingoeca rosetta]|eukprot:XP_004995775.1 hypothetical protein PTSG_03191 [Salpingoeca rosetta]